MQQVIDKIEIREACLKKVNRFVELHCQETLNAKSREKGKALSDKLAELTGEIRNGYEAIKFPVPDQLVWSGTDYIPLMCH